jgi:hypothetical protein
MVFDRTANIDGVPDGYRAMDDREAIKVMIEFRGARSQPEGRLFGESAAASALRRPEKW